MYELTAVALIGCGRYPSGADNAPNRGDELFELERLRDGAVGAGAQVAVHLGGACEEQDRRRRGLELRLFEQRMRQLAAYVQIQQDDVRAVGEPGSRGRHGGGFPHAESLQLEVQPAEQPQRCVVLHEENGRLALPHALKRNETDAASGDMIGAVTSKTGTGELQGYATAVAGLWRGLAGTLSRLDELARDPERSFEDEFVLEELPGLQYSLHRAAELAYGLEPPEGAEGPHVELAAALEEARDATAEVLAGVEAFGPEAAAGVVHEWRGALFRVRLARMRLAGQRPPRPVEVVAEREPVAAPVTAFVLALVGAVGFAAGATMDAWPLWAAGMVCVVAGLAIYRP